MTWESWLAIAAFALALVAFIVVLTSRGSAPEPAPAPDPVKPEGTRDTGDKVETQPQDESDLVADKHDKVVVVFNPTKIEDVDAFKDRFTRIGAIANTTDIEWIETSVEDPGVGQAKEGVRRGADLVVAAGGDGTVRAAIEGLAGSGVALGIIPMGTGNLLARNLNIPVHPEEDAMQAALTGMTRQVDVGFLKARELNDDELAYVKEQHEDQGSVPAGEHAFAVVAGLGFDAAMVGDADSGLKDKFGWYAYGASAMKNIVAEKMKVTVTAGASQPISMEARSILFANCAKLPALMSLSQDARIDDGWLDLGVLDTTGGVIGWVDLVRRMSLKGLGIRNDGLPTTGHLEFRRTKYAVVETDKPEWLQVDGDVLGYASHITVRLHPGGLLVRS